MVLLREREVLKAIQELRKESTPTTALAISRRMHVSKEYVGYLCNRLGDDDYINGHPLRGYELTTRGEEFLQELAASQVPPIEKEEPKRLPFTVTF